MRKQFDDELTKLKTEMKELASLVESSFDKTMKVFFDANEKLAEDVFSLTRSIDKKHRKIENLCFMLLLRYQPVAIDLRTITASLKANFDVKRIASQSFDIAEIVKLELSLNKEKIEDAQLAVLQKMATQTKAMLAKSLETFFALDVSGAEKITAEDDVVDDCFAKIKILIANRLAEKQSGDSAVDILMVAKYFERIADHCVNIARWTVKYFG